MLTTEERVESDRRSRRAWRERNVEAARAASRDYNRRFRAEHPEEARARRLARREVDNAAKVARAKVEAGRVCESCGGNDSDKSWSFNDRYCATCYVRGTRNGFCDECGEARRMTSGRGVHPGTRACSCDEPMPTLATEFEVSLWDALRWRDETALPLARLAELMGLSVRTIDRKSDRILEIFRRWDPEARRERDPEQNGNPAVFRTNLPAVRRGLESLVTGVDAT